MACSQAGNVGGIADAGAASVDANLDADLAVTMDATFADGALDDAAMPDGNTGDVSLPDGAIDPDPHPLCRLNVATGIAPAPGSRDLQLHWDGEKYAAFVYDSTGGPRFQSWTIDGLSMGSGTALEDLGNIGALAVTDTGYGILNSLGTGGPMRFLTYDRNGVRLSDPVPFTSGETFGPLVWNGSEFGFAWSYPSQGKFARFNASGEAIGSVSHVLGAHYATAPAMVWNGSEYGVAYGLYFARVRADGTTALEPTLINSDYLYETNVSMVWTGDAHVLAWIATTPGPDSDHYISVRLQRVSITGTPIGTPTAVATVDVSRGGRIQAPLALVANGSSLAIAWSAAVEIDPSVRRYEVYAQRFTNALEPLGDVVQMTSHTERDPIVAPRQLGLLWNGEEYVVSYVDWISHTNQYYAQSLCH